MAEKALGLHRAVEVLNHPKTRGQIPDRLGSVPANGRLKEKTFPVDEIRAAACARAHGEMDLSGKLGEYATLGVPALLSVEHPSALSVDPKKEAAIFKGIMRLGIVSFPG